MHLKRNSMPKTWPLKRKGTKYIVRTFNLKSSIPLLVIIRDILKLAKDRGEVKKILNSENVKVNGKIIKEEKFPLTLFDNLSLGEKNFKIVLKNKKFSLEESSRCEKIVKLIGKKVLKNGKIQMNLSDGRNYLGKEKIKVGDSVVISFPENRISEVLALKEGCKVLFLRGKHTGEEGTAEKIAGKNVTVKIAGEKINSKLENLIVVR